ncbi:MAG: HAD-IA family hydrolase [Saprospiraceae bacterium]|nr:HAD-IA family hydrolase [Saprospiraceae bacterium]
MPYKNIIFDFGGVLVDWNPRYVYRDYFNTESEMEHFLKNICTDEWNLEQDRGRSMAEGTALLQQQFPEYQALIQVFYDKWEFMLKSDIPANVELLYKLKESFDLYGLTNWSAETISVAYERFQFFSEFRGIVVSGQEKMAKPDKRIFELLLDRYRIEASETIFIDDNIININVAKELGLNAVHCDSPAGLRQKLSAIITLPL